MAKEIHNIREEKRREEKRREEKRRGFIDAARGIAILCVVIGHLTSMRQGIGQYIYSFHMPIFFIISGMLLFYNESWKKCDIITFIVKKAKSLLYPYISFSVLSLIYILITQGVKATLRNTFATVIFDGILTLWFLPALFFAEILFYFMMMRMTKNQRVCLIFCIIIATTLFSFINYQSIENHILRILLRFVNIINRALIGSVFVFIGYWYGYLKLRYNLKGIVVYASIIIAFTLNIFLYQFNYVDLHYSIIGNPFLFYANALLGSYAIINLSEVFLEKSKLLCFFGKNSIVIFATHLNLGIISVCQSITVLLLNHYSVISALILVVIIETILILAVNKYLRILIDYNETKEFIKQHIMRTKC